MTAAASRRQGLGEGGKGAGGRNYIGHMMACFMDLKRAQGSRKMQNTLACDTKFAEPGVKFCPWLVMFLAWLAMFFHLAAEQKFRPLLCKAVPGQTPPYRALLCGAVPGSGHCSVGGGCLLAVRTVNIACRITRKRRGRHR